MTYYSYEEFISDLKSLKLPLEVYSPEAIVSIARGGVTFGHFLSSMLDIRELYSINSIHYNDTKKLDTIDIFNIPDLHTYTKILLVDDIVDSGDTLDTIVKILKEKYPKLQIKTVSIFYKKTAKIQPDFMVKEAHDWIEFFWEEF
ncbi:phosphoribosyltransferase [Arcobacter sp. FWKO B]|uniref:phosphoribosyltransferase n=1 Tax=Arcobacter sp. FWKO B TaxID=2593672 RepID=UPI0018A4C394|nr:phosphoribosyltransferase family protein [Arcobacter sp. FWKO B]QOG12281.1 phosphoribosyltransferase [Arcobacter sp. FWKO B]